MDLTVSKYGAATEYLVRTRICGTLAYSGKFTFTEKFHESDDKRFDAILLLGCQMNHQQNYEQDVINSWCWRGFSKKARAISRVFVKQITVTYSIPLMKSIELADYTGRLSTVGTTDNSKCKMPAMFSDGVLAELRTINGRSHIDGSVDSWIHLLMSPLRWEYDNLECVLPLVFYHKSIGYLVEPKECWVFWKLEMGVRFRSSDKANPKFSRGIQTGGTPS